MNIQLSDHFTYSRLLRFVLPSVIMMVVASIYGVVDGLFVSNFVGKTAFAAVNLIMPYLMLFGTLGYMAGTGGSAIVAATLGVGDKPRANRQFSMLIYATIGLGILLTVVAELLLEPAAVRLGAEGEMLEGCLQYGRFLLPFTTLFILQNAMASFLIAAERPKLGLLITVGAGVTNMVLDFFFIAVLRGGVVGAALATGAGVVVGGFLPLLYFLLPNRSPLRLCRARPEARVLWKACTNGASEFLTNVSMSLVNILYNFQLMRMVGADGVAAYGVLMYVSFIFIGIFFGYSVGSAPIVSYHFGAGNRPELKNLFRKSLVLMALAGILMTLLAIALAGPLARFFVGYNAALTAMTKRAFVLFSLSYLFMGLNIFASSFFTALNNGLISGAISFLRTLVFQVVAVFLLPVLLDLDGIWLAIVLAELMALCVSVLFFRTQRHRYHYA